RRACLTSALTLWPGDPLFIRRIVDEFHRGGFCSRIMPRNWSNRHIGPILAAIEFGCDVGLVSSFRGGFNGFELDVLALFRIRLEKTGVDSPSAGTARPDYPTYLTHLEFALMALTVVAPMLFLVDFVAQDLHAEIYIGSLCWAGYGLGAVVGPLAYG